MSQDVNEGRTPKVTAVAYTNSFSGAPAGRSTSLYVIDFGRDILALQDPANDGTLMTIGDLDVNFGGLGGFDIFSPSEGVDMAYAASNGTFYGIDLASGGATNLGAIGDGNTRLIGLATTKVPEPTTVAALLGVGAFALSSRRRRSADQSVDKSA